MWRHKCTYRRGYGSVEMRVILKSRCSFDDYYSNYSFTVFLLHQQSIKVKQIIENIVSVSRVSRTFQKTLSDLVVKEERWGNRIFQGEVNKKKKVKSESSNKEAHKHLCVKSPCVLRFWWSHLCRFINEWILLKKYMNTLCNNKSTNNKGAVMHSCSSHLTETAKVLSKCKKIK